MKETLIRIKNRFLTLPKDMLRKIYNCRLKRMKLLTRLRLPEDMRWIIEVNVQLANEIHESFITLRREEPQE